MRMVPVYQAYYGIITIGHSVIVDHLYMLCELMS